MVEQKAAATATRHQQRINDLCAASIRALSGEGGLHFRGQLLYRAEQALSALPPHLRPQPGVDDFASFRGAADGMALRLRHSHAGLHQRLRPTEPLARTLFDMLEQFRVESLAPSTMPGMAQNLLHRFNAWAAAFAHDRLTETAQGILLFTVAQIARSRVTAQPVTEATEGAIEATRAGIVPQLGPHLVGLRRSRFDQESYAEHARSIAYLVAGMLAADGSFDKQVNDSVLGLNFWPDDPSQDQDAVFAPAAAGRSHAPSQAGQAYRIFTTAFDTQVNPAQLVRPALLREYRQRLDRIIKAQGLSASRLAHMLHAVLCAPARSGWRGDLEEGYIDGRQLAQLITSPAQRRIFQQETLAPTLDVAASFVIDCSGSMRQHIELVAVLVDVMARSLEQIGVATEVLGFTTRAWGGGRALKAWQRAGCPAHPGRLTETAHWVFKTHAEPWRHARVAMGALLKGDLFREGADGEAVAWAARRLRAIPARRRLLWIISDGSPTDRCTELANDPHYLDRHLCEVLGTIESSHHLQTYGLGVGLDLSHHHRRHLALDLSGGITNQHLRDIVALLAAHTRARAAWSQP